MGDSQFEEQTLRVIQYVQPGGGDESVTCTKSRVWAAPVVVMLWRGRHNLHAAFSGEAEKKVVALLLNNGRSQMGKRCGLMWD